MNHREWVENMQTGLVRLCSAAGEAKAFNVMDMANSAIGVIDSLSKELRANDLGEQPFETPELRWQPIADAPKDGRWIICSRNNGGGSKHSRWIGTWVHDNRGGGYWVDNSDGIRNPTHWQPLDDAPLVPRA